MRTRSWRRRGRRPVVGASVRCDLAADAAHTDADGRFELCTAAEDLRLAQSVMITAHPSCWLSSEPAFSQRVDCASDNPLPGGRVGLGDLTVPATVDVEVVFEFERAATLLATRAGYGIVRVRIGDPNSALSGMLAGTVTRVQVDLADAPPVRVLRVPLRNLVHAVASLEPATRWAVVADHIVTTVVSLTRDRPARTVVPLRSANLLTGRVVDHDRRRSVASPLTL